MLVPLRLSSALKNSGWRTLTWKYLHNKVMKPDCYLLLCLILTSLTVTYKHRGHFNSVPFISIQLYSLENDYPEVSNVIMLTTIIIFFIKDSLRVYTIQSTAQRIDRCKIYSHFVLFFLENVKGNCPFFPRKCKDDLKIYYLKFPYGCSELERVLSPPDKRKN